MGTMNLQDQPELQELTAAWEAERSQLKMRIIQLEHSLVDTIERSNNPLRTTLLSEEKMRLIEEVKREWCAQWNAERDHLLAELKRLRELLNPDPDQETRLNSAEN
jgi:hypothetical protein